MAIGKPIRSQSKGITNIRQLGIAAAASVAIITTGGFLASCGSSQADKSAPPLDASQATPRDAQTATLQGQFIDSAVSGLFYRTETQEGFTDHDGYFSYVDGETVSFYIGSIELGAAPAAEVVTPADLGNSDMGMDDTSLNILRLLQTLDNDGDPANGISITTNTHLAASQLEGDAINVNTDAESFARNSYLLDLIGQVTNLSALIPSENALQHFEQSQQELRLVGRF